MHDSKNLYQGPKPQALKDKQASAGAAHVNAGAGTVLAGVLSANTISGSRASEVSCDHAPPQGGDAESRIQKAKTLCKSVIKSVKCSKSWRMFEKTFKVFAAMLACTNPIEPRFTQDFPLDTGAGRNLISFKGMPKILKGHVAEAPEKVRFATGDSPRPGLKAINLQGSSSGNNTFYVLKECPAALSVGIQVNEHRRFVWMPDQLPFMVKADRVGEMVMHVPESAKIYADRVEQNVPSLSETIQAHAMPFSEGGSSGRVDGKGARSSASARATADAATPGTTA